MLELNVTEKDGNKWVNARELYKELELSKNDNYSKWIKNNLVENEWFINGEDFTYYSTLTGGRPRKDHLITFDTAKHLCMVSRSKNGHKIRKYFIEIESAYTSGQLIEATKQQQVCLEIKDEKIKSLEKAVDSRDRIIEQAIIALQSVNPTEPIGTISKSTGRPRINLRRACYVSAKKDDPNQLVLGFNFDESEKLEG